VLSDGDDAAAVQFERVSHAYDLYNVGSIDAWVEVRDRGSAWPSDEARRGGLDLEREAVTEQYEAGSRYIDTTCVSHGFGEWLDIADDRPTSGYYFTCQSIRTLDHEDPDASRELEVFSWVVSNGKVTAVSSDCCSRA
jgi:hypothetical protein